MTPPKKWPHQCENTRMDTISRAHKIRALTSQCQNKVNEPIVIRNLADILALTYEIEIGMLNVGAQAEKRRLLNGETPVTSRSSSQIKP